MAKGYLLALVELYKTLDFACPRYVLFTLILYKVLPLPSLSLFSSLLSSLSTFTALVSCVSGGTDGGC